MLLLMLALPLYLNYRGQFLFSRIVLSCGPSSLILTSSVVTKVSIDDVTFNDFYNFRIALSVLCVLPLWIFALREFFVLLTTFAFNFSCLAFTNIIHHYFNVRYYDVGFMDKRYDFINITSVTDSKGMGLYQVNLQVTASGGSILIDSEPNTYTRCSFNLPLLK